MPRAPRKPLISEAANTPPGCTAGSSVEDAHESVDLYLDYNGVLNNGAEFREKLCDFMVKLEHIDVLNQNHSDVVRITLLSYRRHRHGCAFTLQELAEAGVLHSFHELVRYVLHQVVRTVLLNHAARKTLAGAVARLPRHHCEFRSHSLASPGHGPHLPDER